MRIQAAHQTDSRNPLHLTGTLSRADPIFASERHGGCLLDVIKLDELEA